MTATLSKAEIIDHLRQHMEAGCTDMLADAPVDHYAAAAAAIPETPDMPDMPNASTSKAAPPSEPSPPSAMTPDTATPQATAMPTAAAMAEPVTPSLSGGEAVTTAQKLAKAATDLDALQAAMHGFEGCALKTTAKSLVFSDGIVGAKIMLIGEAPGQDEDRQGKPFVGRSGQLLDTMLAAIGIDRTENLYISNVVPWRPPGNRTPSLEEIAMCKPFIARHIELAQPDLLLLVGNISNKTLLETDTGITKLRGQWQSYTGDGLDIPTLSLLHPAYVLRRPETKADVWADLCSLKAKLKA